MTNLLDKKHSFAIIGASNDPEKFGYKIYKQLKTLGYKVYPINPKRKSIQGDVAYKSIELLPEKVDVLNFVVPPEISYKITKQALLLGFEIFWYQPGSFDNETLSLHEEKNTQVINNMCLLQMSAKISK